MPSEPVSILEPMTMEPTDFEPDALMAHRPSVIDCRPATWGAEGSGFEVQTGACSYGAFAQALPVDVEAGDQLLVSVWHDRLDAAEPGLAHLAVWLEDAVLWETEVPIPAPSRVYEAEIQLEAGASAGAPLGLHLHNHGFNSWRLVELELTPGP